MHLDFRWAGSVIHDHPGDPFGSVAVPKSGHASLFCGLSQDTAYFACEPFSIPANQYLGPSGDTDGPLRIFSYGEAKHTQEVCFLPNPAGIRNDYDRVLLKGEKVELAPAT